MDITVCVMLPPRGATDYSTSAHAKWPVLAPVSVSPMGNTSEPITAPRTGYIHVTNVPMRPGWASLSNDEARSRVTGAICRTSVEHPRLWVGDPSMLAPPLRNQLLTDRQITITWGQYKAMMRSRVDNRPMADEDLE